MIGFENRVSSIGNKTVALRCASLWNMASDRFRSTNLLTVAKKEARILSMSLPP